MLTAMALVVVGVLVGVVLARAVLGGLLRMMIREARHMFRRVTQRRSALRPDDHDRRHTERRSTV